MSAQSEALRLADLWEKHSHGYARTPEAKTAAELRRLAAENEAFGIHLSERMKDLALVEAQRDEARRTVRDAHEAGTRLAAQRDALLDACKAYDKWADKTHCYDRELRPIRAQIRAAIKAVEENT